MKLYSTEVLIGKEYEQLGLVTGNVAYALRVGKMLNIGISTLAGGIIDDISDAINKAKEVAELRIKIAAEKMGADAIVGLRISATNNDSIFHVEYYGTAIKFK